MFESISDPRPGVPRGGAGSLVASWALHLGATAVVVAAPFLGGVSVPEAPSMMAFVVPVAAAPPPPPPPPAPAPASVSASPTRTSPSPDAAPIDVPTEIAPERPAAGVSGAAGVEGGVEGGVPGGVVGGLPLDAPPPPPPPPPVQAPPEPRGPVRIGGAVSAPELLRRVNPEYPALAQRAFVQGVVVLEATVNEQGRVIDVRVLRPIPLLNEAALAAVRQWQYRPLLLNGRAAPFIVTVTLTFNLHGTA